MLIIGTVLNLKLATIDESFLPFLFFFLLVKTWLPGCAGADEFYTQSRRLVLLYSCSRCPVARLDILIFAYFRVYELRIMFKTPINIYIYSRLSSKLIKKRMKTWLTLFKTHRYGRP